TPTPTPQPLTFAVYFHPDGNLYVGDRISLEVVAPPAMQHQTVRLQFEGQTLGEGTIEPSGIGGRSQATFPWVWDTAGLEAGAHTLNISLPQRGLAWEESVTLMPREALPREEKESAWLTAESTCCVFYLLSHSAAERDIDTILATADAQLEQARQALPVTPSAPIPITLMARVLGQGGFASDELFLSYLDRNYAGGDFAILLRHEMIHRLDNAAGGDYRPPILAEGLAVYLSGGHYKPEALTPRAAALLSLAAEQPDYPWFYPLDTLANEFYLLQHEIGYIQAGALVEFMVNRWGWEAFEAFYRSLPQPGEGDTPASVLNAALQARFGLSLSQLEHRFRQALEAQIPSAGVVQDVRLTVAYYETMRRYQQRYDPSAYFLHAWLPDVQTMRAENIVADLWRHPQQVTNLVLESLLLSADRALRRGDRDEAEHLLNVVKVTLTAAENQAFDPLASHPLSARMARAIHSLKTRGYSPEYLLIEGETLQAAVRVAQNELMFLELQENEAGFTLQPVLQTAPPNTQ
ncbi:MAG: hypothetical protein D6803_02455, partial [Anaerolineae bacterium]